MGSVPSINPGVADLLDKLSNLKSPAISSPNVVTALKSAPTADIVQLSNAASQLEGIDAMFGIATSGTDELGNSLLAELQNAANAAPSFLTSASPADQAANADATVQSELTQGLFGTPSNPLGTLFNTTG